MMFQCVAEHCDTMAGKDYNSRLSSIVDKGLCGDPENCESTDALRKKVKKLAVLIEGTKKVVAFTGAGISTSCGIPDFRGPNGVWTKEQRGEATSSSTASNVFDTARPSFTHFALACLVHLGIVNHIVSQNVDSLHLRSGVPDAKLTELHGNIFKEKCVSCGNEYLRDFDVAGMGLKPTGRFCDTGSCRGILKDEAYDWDTPLNDDLFQKAEEELDEADIVICMGTSLRVVPANHLPQRVLEYNNARGWKVGKMVIVNLQKTDWDKDAEVRIFHYCDDVMRLLCRELGLTLVDSAQIQGDDVASWYTVEKGSILEKMALRREEEKTRAPRRTPKPRDFLTAPLPTKKRKSDTKSFQQKFPAVVELDDSPPQKQAKKTDNQRDVIKAPAPKKSAKGSTSAPGNTSSASNPGSSCGSSLKKKMTALKKAPVEVRAEGKSQPPAADSLKELYWSETSTSLL